MGDSFLRFVRTDKNSTRLSQECARSRARRTMVSVWTTKSRRNRSTNHHTSRRIRARVFLVQQIGIEPKKIAHADEGRYVTRDASSPTSRRRVTQREKSSFDASGVRAKITQADTPGVALLMRIDCRVEAILGFLDGEQCVSAFPATINCNAQ